MFKDENNAKGNGRARGKSVLLRHEKIVELVKSRGFASEVAKALLDHKGLRVITNNLNVATVLSKNESFEVIITGGVVRSRDRGITGEATIDFIQQFKIDFGVISVSGIDWDGTLLDFDYHEIRVGRAIIGISRKVFLVADHTKFGREAMVRLCNIEEVDALFTDRRPQPSMTRMLSEADVILHVAKEESGVG